MDDISPLFSEHSELFSVYEELKSYSELIAVPLGEVPDEFDPHILSETGYPVLSDMHLILHLILPLLSCLSARFLFNMIQKHR